MFVHTISYMPDASGVWLLNAASGHARRFTSRLAALDFAKRDAAARAPAGSAVMIRLEGADGVWRSFDAEMQGLPLPASRAG